MSVNDDKSDAPSQSSSILDLPNTFDIGGQTGFSSGDVADSTLISVTSSAPEIASGDLEYEDVCMQVADPPSTSSENIGFSSHQETLFRTGRTFNIVLSASERPIKGEEEEDFTGKNIDSFYSNSSKPENTDRMFQLISELLASKVSQLKEKGEKKYVLRSFQMAQILLNSHGTKIFQNHQASLSSTKSSDSTAEKIRPIPGLSMDVIKYVLDNIKEGVQI
ncbi:shieldin complex subunit 1-like [Polyodon spathula]|uniref:shieldin complex subunit 1-like n=1 Tax=Polyodon spathula TaxID=7913 RepID=UPI001B7E8CD1|nr:shieldin complex subunit 1-like [Polyodon spathula]XP_041106490.1 shieldin complex subunit 1-like [Polyodon spathula]